MPFNTITGTARIVGTFPVRMRLVGTSVWATGALDTGTGDYVCTLTNVPAGSYAPGTIEYQLLGSNPLITTYNTNVVTVTNGSGGSTPVALAVTFSYSGASSITAGTTLTYSAAASGGAAPYQHAVTATNSATGQVTAIGSASTASYTSLWQNPPAGKYELVDTVTDAAGTTKISAVRTLDVTAGSTNWDGRPIMIIAEGDSLVEGYINTYPVDQATTYPSRLQVALGSNFVVKNLGIGGTDTKQMLDRAAANVDSLYDPVTYFQTYYILHGGINNWLIPHNPTYTVEQALSELRQNLQARQAKGIRAIASIIVPTNQPFEQTFIKPTNAAMLSQYPSWGITGLCDFRKTLGYEEYNTAYVATTSDGVHRNDVGYQRMARDARDTVKALVTPFGVPVPAYLFPFEGGSQPQPKAVLTFPALASKPVGQTGSLGVTSTNTSTPITHTSSNSAVVSVTSSGQYTTVTNGSATITASQPAGAGYLAADSVSQVLQVQAAPTNGGAFAMEDYQFTTLQNATASADGKTITFNGGYSNILATGKRAARLDGSPVIAYAEYQFVQDGVSKFIFELNIVGAGNGYASSRYAIHNFNGFTVQAFGAASGKNPSTAEGGAYINPGHLTTISVKVFKNAQGLEQTDTAVDGNVFSSVTRPSYYIDTIPMDATMSYVISVKSDVVGSTITNVRIGGTNLVTVA